MFIAGKKTQQNALSGSQAQGYSTYIPMMHIYIYIYIYIYAYIYLYQPHIRKPYKESIYRSHREDRSCESSGAAVFPIAFTGAALRPRRSASCAASTGASAPRGRTWPPRHLGPPWLVLVSMMILMRSFPFPIVVSTSSRLRPNGAKDEKSPCRPVLNASPCCRAA